MGGPTVWGLGEELTTPHRRKRILLRNVHIESLGPGLLLWYKLGNEMDIRFGAWNVRSLYRVGSLIATARELARHKLDLVGA